MAIPGPMTDVEVAAVAATVPWTATCMHPDCANPCDYRGASKGRQKAFCTAACRAKYSRQRAELVGLWLRLTWTEGFRLPTSKARQVGQLLRQVEWLLERYGGIETIDENKLPQPPAAPLDVLMDHLEGIDHDDDPVWIAHRQEFDEFYANRIDKPPLSPRPLRLRERVQAPQTQPAQR